jgi:hypothetical protein
MVLVTVTRLLRGYRLLATSSVQSRYYCWSLYRNSALLAVISRNYQGENSITFDLYEPLALGQYALRVECFDWQPAGATPVFAYHTDRVALHLTPVGRIVLGCDPL